MSARLKLNSKYITMFVQSRCSADKTSALLVGGVADVADCFDGRPAGAALPLVDEAEAVWLGTGDLAGSAGPCDGLEDLR